MVFETITVRSADPDYFISHVDVTGIKENREAEMALARMPGDLADAESKAAL